MHYIEKKCFVNWRFGRFVRYMFFSVLDEHAFQVLRSKNVTYKGYEFMALEVRVPADGLSKSSNWCYDYQYLCKDFHRRPTGCGITYISDTYHNYCRVKYNSDMNIGNSLGCNPSNNIADLANIAFPNMSRPAHYSNAFGFYQCWSCNKTIRASRLALAYMEDFWQSNMTTFYTVCR